MNSSTQHLPNDTDELQSLVLSQQKNLDSLASINADLASDNTKLEHRIDSLEDELRLHRIKRFQAQSEQAKNLLEETGFEQTDIFPETLAALLEELGLGPEEEAPPAISVPAHMRKPRKSRTLDASLPRVEVVHDLTDKSCDHCGDEMTCIGEEPPLEQLAIVPAKQFVIRHIRKKYACRCKRCIKRADMPRQPIPKSQASPQLLAFLMVSKFLDGLPLYRLENIVARYGLQLSRQNMARWLIQSSDHFDRLLHAFEHKLLEYDIVLADETRLQVLNEPGRDPTTKSWLWIRRGGPPGQAVILVDYDPSRAAKVPNALLEAYKDGYLVVDAYAGYFQVAAANGLKLVGCHDHARRKFKDAYDSLSVKARQSKGGIANQAIKRYQLLYKIERELKDKTPEIKKQVRQEKSLPLLEDFKAWLATVKQQGIAHDKTLIAINYFINQYDTLIRYCEDGRLPISNILSEHVAKSIAIARKNFLFANTQSGATAAAKIYSIVLTAAQNGLEPIGYLTAVLTKMPNIKGNESIDHLLPWNLTQEQLNQYLASMPSI